MGCFIVAEAGINHMGSLTAMLLLCDAAKQAGADAVKFQAFNAAALIERRGITDEATCALLRQTEITDHQLEVVADYCLREGVKWFASVFDPSQVARVLRYGACALKIGHKECDWDELCNTCSSEWRRGPLFISGVDICGTWEYPATSPPCLLQIDRRDVIGFSSHYADWRIPAAAALRGASYVEAHLKLSDSDPEAAWSLSGEDFGKMVRQIREYETWL